VGDGIAPLLSHWREFMPEAPDCLRWGFSLRIADESQNTPPAVRGLPVASVSALWVGDIGQGRRYLHQALSAAHHTAVSVEEMSFLRLQTLADSDFPHGRRYYTKSGYFRLLGDRVIQTMIAALATVPSRASEIELAYLGGAAQRVAPEETAFGDRSAPFVVNIISNWADPVDDAANIAWTRNLFAQ
jgi:hypothetical protein